MSYKSFLIVLVVWFLVFKKLVFSISLESIVSSFCFAFEKAINILLNRRTVFISFCDEIKWFLHIFHMLFEIKNNWRKNVHTEQRYRFCFTLLFLFACYSNLSYFHIFVKALLTVFYAIYICSGQSYPEAIIKRYPAKWIPCPENPPPIKPSPWWVAPGKFSFGKFPPGEFSTIFYLLIFPRSKISLQEPQTYFNISLVYIHCCQVLIALRLKALRFSPLRFGTHGNKSLRFQDSIYFSYLPRSITYNTDILFTKDRSYAYYRIARNFK